MYISEDEKRKCKKIVDAYTELYDASDVLVLDAGKYGFVKLQFYRPEYGFDNVLTFTDSKLLFNDLWEEWLNMELITLATGTPLEYKSCKDIFKCLSEEKQKELMSKRNYFVQKVNDKFFE